MSEKPRNVTLTSFDGVPFLGQKTSANSIPVVLASDQTFDITVTNANVAPNGDPDPGYTAQIGGSDAGVLNPVKVNSAGEMSITGTISASNPSVSDTGSAVPSQATFIGGSDGTDLRALKVATDGTLFVALPTNAATESTLTGVLTTSAFQARINTFGQKTGANSTPVVLASDTDAAVHLSAAIPAGGNLIGSVNQGTSPWVVGDGGGSLTVDSAQLPGALTGSGNLKVAINENNAGLATESTLAGVLTIAAFQARINTLGQKAMAASTPVVLASDQSPVPITTTQLPAGYSHDTNNEQVGFLAGGATFTGSFTDVSNVPLLMFAYVVDAQPVSVTIEWSSDGITPDPSLIGQTAIDIVAAGGGIFIAAAIETIKVQKYYRIKVVNGASPQTILATEAILNPTVSYGDVRYLVTEPSDFTFSLTTNAIMKFRDNSSQSYKNVSATNPMPVLANAGTNLNTSALLTTSDFQARVNTLGQKTMANSMPMVIASDQSPVPITGSITATNPSVSATGAAVPADATMIGGSDGTNLRAIKVSAAGVVSVDAATLPLPSGAATEATLAGVLTTSAFQARINTFGQKTMANSTPIVIASDQTAIPITAASLPLPSGAATEATLAGVLTTSAFQARINTLGQKTGANSTPVVLASDTVLPLPTGAATESTLSSLLSHTGTFTHDTGNEQTVPLSAGATYTGTFFDASAYGSIVFVYFTDVSLTSATIEWSHDGVTLDPSLFGGTGLEVYNPGAGTYIVSHVETTKLAKYYRIKIVNSGANQTTVSARCALYPGIYPGAVRFNYESINASTAAGLITHAIMKTANSSGSLKTNTNRAVGSSIALDVALVDGSGAQITDPALNTTLTDGTQKSIVRGGAKGATVAADVTSLSETADIQSLNVSGTLHVKELITNGTLTTGFDSMLFDMDFVDAREILFVVDLRGTFTGGSSIQFLGGNVPPDTVVLGSAYNITESEIFSADTFPAATFVIPAKSSKFALAWSVGGTSVTGVYVWAISNRAFESLTISNQYPLLLQAAVSGPDSTGTTYTANPIRIGGSNSGVVTDVQTDGSGNLQVVGTGTFVVQISSGTISLPSNAAQETGGNLATLAGGVSGAKYQTNVSQINGVAPSMGNGASGTGVQRVTLANDSTGIVSLTTSTASIGKLASNSGVTIGTVELAAAQTLATVTTVSTVTSITNPVTADTELPAAATIAADGVTPTVPGLAAYGFIKTPGANTWDRIYSVVNATNSTGTGIQAAGILAQFDDVSPTAITENQFGNIRMSANRNLYGTVRDAAGNERGANVNASNQLSVSVDNSPTITSTAEATSLVYTAAQNATKTQIKGSAATLWKFIAENANTSVVYLQIFNKLAASVTVGTTVADDVIPIAAGNSATDPAVEEIAFPKVTYGTGLTIAITTTRTGNTNPGTSIPITVYYI